jgi:GxxExxY protein
MNENKILYKELSYKIIGMALKIHSILGPGLFENIYQKAYCILLEEAGIPYICQKPYPVYFKNRLLGNYFADLVVDDSIIVELKSVKTLNGFLEAQIINYLKISGLKIGYLINFNSQSLIWKRYINKSA